MSWQKELVERVALDPPRAIPVHLARETSSNYVFCSYESLVRMREGNIDETDVFVYFYHVTLSPAVD